MAEMAVAVVAVALASAPQVVMAVHREVGSDKMEMVAH
jgi:hypothetical protein